MKKQVWIALFILLTTIGCVSCGHRYYYGVVVENNGKETIILERFRITSGKYGVVDVGYLYPGKRGGVAPFYTKPNASVGLSWRNLRTGEKGSGDAVVDLPKEFSGKEGSYIRFNVFPTTNRVEVIYGIVDQKGTIREIKGKP